MKLRLSFSYRTGSFRKRLNQLWHGGYSHRDDRVAFQVERDGADRRSVAPAQMVACSSFNVERMAAGKTRVIITFMALRRTNVADGAVAAIDVVPIHEVGRPGPGSCQIDEALGWKLWAVLGGSTQRLGIGVVVVHARPGVRRFDVQPVQHCQHGRCLERGPVAACSVGLMGMQVMSSASATRCTEYAAWIESSLSCTSQPTTFRL